MVYLKCKFRFIGMQFVRQKLKIFITWSIFIQIEKMTPQNRKSRQAQQIGQGPKITKNTHFKPKNGFSGVTKFFGVITNHILNLDVSKKIPPINSA